MNNKKFVCGGSGIFISLFSVFRAGITRGRSWQQRACDSQLVLRLLLSTSFTRDHCNGKAMTT